MSRVASPVGASETDLVGEKKSEKEGARACAEWRAVRLRPRQGGSTNREPRSRSVATPTTAAAATPTRRTLSRPACVTAPFVDRQSGRAASAAHSRGRGYLGRRVGPAHRH